MIMDKIIVESVAPTRLDRYLRRHYPNMTQGIIEKSLRKNQIKLNGKKSKTNIRVIRGDIITILPGILIDNNHKNTQTQKFSQNTISLAKKILSEYILFFSEEFIAINKPENLAVQGGSKISTSIDSALQYINYIQNTREDNVKNIKDCKDSEYYNDNNDILSIKASNIKSNIEPSNLRKTNYKLVHRLDKDTSGILLIANGFENAFKLGEAFQQKIIQKTYIALLGSCPEKSEGILTNKIGKEKSGTFEKVKELDIGGKIAKTHYKILESNSEFSLVEFKPITGRMHQLRFHSQFLGCPIVGDSKYGGKKYKRMLLHAKRITIPASVFGCDITIESNLPRQLQTLML